MDVGTWSHSDATVLEAVRDCLDEGRDAALVTLVAVDGSAYRRPGAKRLLEPDGKGHGTIVPGCLDAELRRAADTVRETGEPTTVTVDLGDGESWGLGVGCDGVVELFVEPLDQRLEPALDALADGRAIAIGTVLDSETSGVSIGDRTAFAASGSPVAGGWPSWLRDDVADIVAEADERASDTVTVDGSAGSIEVFVDWLAPSPRLVVFGTGPDVVPLVETAQVAGFRPEVVGFRGEGDADRFPAASSVVTARPADVREAVDLDTDTAAVVATHNFVDDRLTVEQLVGTPVPYIGVVGSHDRFERLLDALETDLSAADRERLFGPAGLDLGGEIPGQIALSIVSEALAVYNDRTPGHLRERERPIHERSSAERERQQ